LADWLTLVGKWPGNLCDFRRRVYLKLTADLKVPFPLVTAGAPVPEALREPRPACAAQLTIRTVVVKRPDSWSEP